MMIRNVYTIKARAHQMTSTLLLQQWSLITFHISCRWICNYGCWLVTSTTYCIVVKQIQTHTHTHTMNGLYFHAITQLHRYTMTIPDNNSSYVSFFYVHKFKISNLNCSMSIMISDWLHRNDNSQPSVSNSVSHSIRFNPIENNNNMMNRTKNIQQWETSQ